MNISELKSELSSHSKEASLDFIANELIPEILVDDVEKTLFDETIKTIHIYRMCKNIFLGDYTFQIIRARNNFVEIAHESPCIWVEVASADVRVFSGIRHAICTLHDFSLKVLKNIYAQIERHSLVTKKNGIKCQHCKKSFQDLLSLRNHREHHTIEEERTQECILNHSCSRCGVEQRYVCGGWHHGGHRQRFKHEAKCYGFELLYNF